MRTTALFAPIAPNARKGLRQKVRARLAQRLDMGGQGKAGVITPDGVHALGKLGHDACPWQHD